MGDYVQHKIILYTFLVTLQAINVLYLHLYSNLYRFLSSLEATPLEYPSRKQIIDKAYCHIYCKFFGLSSL